MLFLVIMCLLTTASAQTTESALGTSLMHVYMSQGPHAAYQLVDTNKDDSLTLKEFQTFFNRLDNGDGKMNLAEFIKATSMIASMARKEFNLLDKDSNGFLTPDEVKVVYTNFDANEDNSVTEKEFREAYDRIVLLSHGMVVG